MIGLKAVEGAPSTAFFFSENFPKLSLTKAKFFCETLINLPL